MIFIKSINYIFTFFRLIYIFQAKQNKKIKAYKNIYLKTFTSLNKTKNVEILNYLKENNKIKRFKNKYILLVLFYKKKFVCCGWMHEGTSWYISEINKNFKIKNFILFFDFFTFPKFRKKSFYKKILILIRNKRTQKPFLIYCLSSNSNSKKGILNAGFNLKDKIKKI